MLNLPMNTVITHTALYSPPTCVSYCLVWSGSKNSGRAQWLLMEPAAHSTLFVGVVTVYARH